MLGVYQETFMALCRKVRIAVAMACLEKTQLVETASKSGSKEWFAMIDQLGKTREFLGSICKMLDNVEARALGAAAVMATTD